MKKNRVLNFKERKIENDYVAFEINMRYQLSLDSSLSKIEQDIKYLCKEYFTKNKEVIINLFVEPEIDEYEALNIMNIIARETLTDKKNDRDYLYQPMWFKDAVDLDIITQNDLGNYENKFEKLQIIIHNNDKEWKLVN